MQLIRDLRDVFQEIEDDPCHSIKVAAKSRIAIAKIDKFMDEYYERMRDEERMLEEVCNLPLEPFVPIGIYAPPPKAKKKGKK